MSLLDPDELEDARELAEELMTIPATVSRSTLGADRRNTWTDVWSGLCAASHLSTEQQEQADRLYQQKVVLFRMPVTADVKENDRATIAGTTRQVVEVEDLQTPHDVQLHVWLTDV